MDFLRGVLSKSSGLPGYTLLDKLDLSEECLYTLHNATRREDGLACSVLTFDATPSVQPLARNFVAKLRSMKHPSILQYLDTAEVDGVTYVAIERVEPLSYTLNQKPAVETLGWGLYAAAQAIQFINNSACVHGNVRVSSLFTSVSGEWKLGGFEVLSSMMDEDPFICRHGGFLKEAYSYTPPELQQRGFSELKSYPVTALDAYGFGCLLYTVFNGPFRSASELQQQKKIPSGMLAQYKRLLMPSATSRLSVSALIDHGRRPGGFFDTEIVKIAEQVPSLAMLPHDQVEAFLQAHMKALGKLPRGFSKAKVLPELARSFEQGGGGATSFKAVLSLAKDFTPDETEALLVPILLRAWQSSDRAVRLVLLESLADYVDLLSAKQINDKLFSLLGSSFSDPAPILREAAIRSLMILSPHLSDRNLNGDLLKLLAKSANDTQPGIRTNTTICLGKVARALNPSSARKVLTAAFARALKDPFVHARLAACQAISATVDIYEKDDLAVRLLPGLMPLLIDGEGVVRRQAKTTIDALLARILTLTKDMQETLQHPTAQKPQQAASGASVAGGAIETAGVWAGWAVSKLSRNLDAAANQAVSGTSTPVLVSEPVSRSATPSNPSPQSQSHAQSQAQARGAVVMGASTGAGLKLATKPRKKMQLVEESASDEDVADAWALEEEAAPARKLVVKRQPAVQPVAQTTTASTVARATAKSVETESRMSSGVKAPAAGLKKSNLKAKKVAEEIDWDDDAWS